MAGMLGEELYPKRPKETIKEKVIGISLVKIISTREMAITSASTHAANF